jgi:hypothetical protein
MKYTFGLLLLLFSATTFGQDNELEVKGFGRLKTQPDLGVLHIELTTIQKEFGTTGKWLRILTGCNYSLMY